MDNQWDEVAKEADLLKIADAVGVYGSGPRELPDDDEKRRRAERIRIAREAARKIAREAPEKGVRPTTPAGGYPGARALHRRLRHIQALDHALGYHKYPSAHETYRSTDVWQNEAATREAYERNARSLANRLAAEGWPTDVISRVLDITPRSQS